MTCNIDKYTYRLDSPRKLWHYTGTDGLLGIIDNGVIRLRFTRSDCLNDTSEGEDILHHYQSACEKLFAGGDIDEARFRDIRRITPNDDYLITYPLAQRTDASEPNVVGSILPCDVFICSFSAEADCLDMWRYYSKGQCGYSIGFYASALAEVRSFSALEYSPAKEYSQIELYKVSYTDEEKERFFSEMILDCCSRESANPQRELQYYLNSARYVFKNACFRNEHEYRAVFFRPKAQPSNMESHIPAVHFRNQNGIIAPYIEIALLEQSDAVRSLYVSPYMKDAGAAEAALDFMRMNGFARCEVVQSTLPVR